ncbi:DNA repair ATPase [Streptomyces mayteni]
MTTAHQPTGAAGTATDLDAGTYELLRDRLRSAAADLAERAGTLNARRVETFGGRDLALLATDRVRTGQPAVPREVVAVGGLLLVGYRPPADRPAAAPGDVLALHRVTDEGLTPAPEDAVPGLLDDPAFRRDFADLYRYYRQARLLRLRVAGSLLLAVFQTGERATDVRAFRWRLPPEGPPSYLDAQGERDHVPPPAHDFAWREVDRADHVPGPPPHAVVDGALLVSTVGGELSVRTAADAEAGRGGYREPVAEPLQSLADARIAWARLGPLLLLRVRPYNEPDHRHLVHNTRTGETVRLDGVGQACRALPEDQGLVFPGGTYLAAAPAGAAARTFDVDARGLAFERVVRSPNGEDVLYVFLAPDTGRTLLLPYNLIAGEVANPLVARGHALLDDGTMALVREPADGDQPGLVHTVQLWRTPFVSETHAAATPAGTGPLARIGNADLVRGVSDALTVARMATELAPGTAVFEAIVAACDRLTDQYHWLPLDGLAALHEPVATLRETAEAVVAEYARVTEAQRGADEALATADTELTALLRRARGEAPRAAEEWVALLTRLRRAQGRLETLREVRRIDLAALTALGERVADGLAATGRRAVAFLSRPDAFDATGAAIEALAEEAAALTTAAGAEPLAARIAEHAEGLGAVTDVVGGLDIADAVVRTALLERIGAVLGAVNRARAVLDRRRAELAHAEGRAEFAAEYALLGQAVAGALATADTPEQCEEHLGRLLLQVENLEARFGAFDDFLTQLTERREEIYETFAARKQAALDERARQGQRLAASADRILTTVTRRATRLGTLDEVNAYFATDPLVARVRATVDELRAIDDTVRADELAGRLKAARQEAGRALRDHAELHAADGTVRLGRHRFSVTPGTIDLTLLPHDGGLAVAVTGTDYRAPLDPASELLGGTREFWDQPVVSEAQDVYRAETLAARLLTEPGPAALDLAAADGTLPELVRAAAEAAYDEGYDRGVHDHDATAILRRLLPLRAAAGLLRFPPDVRAADQLFWAHGAAAACAGWAVRAQSLARARAAIGAAAPAAAGLAAGLATAAGEFLPAGLAPTAAGDPWRLLGDYLFEELAAGGPVFVAGAPARALLDDFRAALGSIGVKELAQDLRSLDDDLAARHQLLTAWLAAFAADAGRPTDDLPEAAALDLCADRLDHRPLDAPLTATATGLLGAHPRLSGGELPLRLDEFLTRTAEFTTRRMPAHRAWTRARSALLDAERERLRLAAYRPRVLTTFVRNRLIDEVYLPLIGDSLAKQLGAAGDERRTDSQGLLLLLSPPGYGKTTLLEYVAARLGLALVRADGPALGHGTTSLDPAAAPDAAARREVEKINFALEMGNNVLLHVDDIQHVSPELLQRFIPLTDAQRRVDGVRTADGRPVTYDLRGKRFAICMAGNPFTESGTRFRVPDMLANRADVWNLGDVLTGREELFELSHLENALAANPVLAPLATRDLADVDLLVRLARGDRTASADRLVHPYDATELERVLAVLRLLLRVQRTTLRVNAAYIASATQEETDRTEPPFRLQGSYRDTNRLAEQVLPVMTDAEVEALIDDHYRAEAQTLASGAEANLLKLAELRGRLTPPEAERWAELKRSHLRRAGAKL